MLSLRDIIKFIPPSILLWKSGNNSKYGITELYLTKYEPIKLCSASSAYRDISFALHYPGMADDRSPVLIAQTPHRKLGVFTGASHNRTISSSTFSNVMEQPCISKEVI